MMHGHTYIKSTDSFDVSKSHYLPADTDINRLHSEANQLPALSDVVRNEWNFSSTVSCDFM